MLIEDFDSFLEGIELARTMNRWKRNNRSYKPTRSHDHMNTRCRRAIKVVGKVFG